MSKMNGFQLAKCNHAFCADHVDHGIIKVEDQNDQSDHFSSKYVERNCIMSRKRPTAGWPTVLREERVRRALEKIAKFAARRKAEEDFKKELEKESLLTKQRRKRIRELQQDTTKN